MVAPRAPTEKRDPAGLVYPGLSTGIEALSGVGVCSTRPSATGDTHELGVDTLRLLFETHDFGDRQYEIEQAPGWTFGSIPSIGLTWAEGHPTPGALASATAVADAGQHVRELLDERFGVLRDRGVARSDQTVTVKFPRPEETRAFIAGMAAVQLPRTETTRRGHPVHSVSWTHATGRRKLARVYDKGFERGGEPWELARMEDQRRYPSGARPPLEALDGEYLSDRFAARFGPIRRAVDGVKAASFPVVMQAIADEAKYGYRDVREAERMAGALVLLSGGAGTAYPRRSFYRRRAELKDAGYVVVDDLVEAVEVNLGDVVEQAIEADW
jgi:hypothetical protein